VKNIPGPIEGIAFVQTNEFDDVNHTRFFLHGQGFCVYVDLGKDIPSKAKLLRATDKMAVSIVNEEEGLDEGNVNNSQTIISRNTFQFMSKKRKKKSESNSDASNFTIIQAYRSLVYVSSVQDSQLVSNSFMVYICVCLREIERKKVRDPLEFVMFNR
jgi:hypothetical protein